MVFIHGNVPSSKNSKISTSKGVFHSKTVGRYLSELGISGYNPSKKEIKLYKTKPCTFPFDDLKLLFSNAKKGEPIQIGFHLVRANKHRFDFHNICQILLDLLVAADIIEDDDMDHILPFPMKYDGKWYHVDKDNPGVWITILNPIDMPDSLYPRFYGF